MKRQNHSPGQEFRDRVARHEAVTMGELKRKLYDCSRARGLDLEVSIRSTSNGGPQGDQSDTAVVIKSGGKIIDHLSDYSGDILAALEGGGT